jgi:hypothetical protein
LKHPKGIFNLLVIENIDGPTVYLVCAFFGPIAVGDTSASPNPIDCIALGFQLFKEKSSVLTMAANNQGSLHFETTSIFGIGNIILPPERR